ncbi:integrase, catalytic region, zinc finger, CCHC-type containing protein [Tanacetum coccineum]
MNVIKPGMYRIDTRPTQTRTPQLPQSFRNSNPRVSTSTGILFIVDSGCTKHMTGNLKLLCNFVEKDLGMVRFGNDQFALIIGCGNLVQGNVTIKRIYYVEGLNHNLFSVGQLCDANLEVAFRKSTCFVRDLQGNDLLTGTRGFDLYTISLQEASSLTLIYFMEMATPTQAWLWHHRLSHLNFNTINMLSKNDIVNGLPKLKYVNDQLCSSCELVRDGENLDKMKEKGDTCIFVGNSTQSKGYRVYNKRTRLIVESIHINFDDLNEENNNDPAENASFEAYEFINPFDPPGPEAAESSSCNVDTLHMHTFYQRHRFDYHWTKDRPLEQVRGDPSKPVQTR